MAFAGNQPNRKNIDFTPQGSAPSDAVAGSTIYHSTSGLIFYTGTEWVATSGTGGGASALNNLTDVNTAGVSETDVLAYSGSTWVPSGITQGASALDDLTDVATAGHSDGKALTSNGSSFSFESLTLADQVAGALNDLTDVNTAGLTAEDSLVYDGSNWVPSGVTGGSASLSGLTDTNLTSPASGQFLQYNGTDWVSATPSTPDGHVWKSVASGSIASLSSITTPSISSNAKKVQFCITNIDVTADLLWLLRGVDSGDTAIQADYSHAQTVAVNNSTVGRATNANDSRIELIFDTLGANDTTSDGEGQLTLIWENPEFQIGDPSTVNANFRWHTCFLDTIGRTTTIHGHGCYAGTTAIDKLEVFTNTSTFSNGEYEILELVPMQGVLLDASPTALNDLTDVTAASPASGDMLKYNGSNWESYTTDAVYVDRIIQSVDGQTATADIETLNIDNYSSQNVSRVEWYIFDIDVTADLALELIAQTYVSDVVTDNTGSSDYCWHLDGGAATETISQGDNADDSIFLSFSDATRTYDTDVNGKGSARIAWVNPAEHMANPSTVPAHFEYSTSLIRPNGQFQSSYGHGFYYGATGTSDMCTALKVKTSTSTFTCSHNVMVKIEKRL
jgi:hypothetical protein